MKYFVSLFFLVLFIACGDSNKIEPPVEESDITLSLDGITFEAKGGSERVILKSKTPWKALNLPEWISISKTEGDTNAEIIVEVKANRKELPRSFTIAFVSEKSRVELEIVQHKAPVEPEVKWSKLNFTMHYELGDMILGDDQKTRIYTFKTDRVFINRSKLHGIGSKAYLGNIFATKLLSSTDMKVYDGYSFDNITVSSSTLTMSKTFVPSLENQKIYADEIISEMPTQSESFVTDNSGVEYHSHRELNLIGMSNMGEKLDELISGHSYQTKEMKKNTGIIYSYGHSKFSMYMDIPHGPVPEESLPKEPHSFIISVTYGRVGLLIVESDFSEERVRMVVKKVFTGKDSSLSNEENDVIEEFDAYHLYFDYFGILRVKRGKLDAVKSYVKEITEDSSIVYPISFELAELAEFGLTKAEFQVTLP